MKLFVALAILAHAAAFSSVATRPGLRVARRAHGAPRARATSLVKMSALSEATTKLEHPPVFAFGDGDGTEGATALKWLLGGKGSNL